MRRALRIKKKKKKLGFINGTLYEPKDRNDSTTIPGLVPLMEHWLRCNDIFYNIDAKCCDNKYQ